MNRPLPSMLTWAICWMASAGFASAATIRVFAAASLTESLQEIGAAYAERSGDKILFNFAASGPLARQIEEGAPADLFFSADEARMDALEKKGLIVQATRRSRLSNLLVFITLADSPLAIAAPKDLAAPSVKRIACGDPQTVPVGAYAKAFLSKLDLWPRLEAKVVPCESVRAVLAAVESGNVDIGIVYQTDAAISKKAETVFKVSREEGPAISYPVALVKESKEPAAAARFLEYLCGDAAGATFAKHGFIVL